MNLIREYQPEDYQQVEDCFIALQDFEQHIESNRVDGKTIAKQYLDFMFTRCGETNGKVFVAEFDNKVVGFVSIWLRVNSKSLIERDSEYAYISDLIVLSDYREQGLGRALMQKAEDYALNQGAKTLKVEVLAKNEVARELYNKCGFQENEVALLKKFQPENPDAI